MQKQTRHVFKLALGILAGFGIFIIISQSVQQSLIMNRTLQNSETLQEAYEKSTKSISSLLDGCYHVYLDVGSNIGVQVRKLYEPSKYKNAPFVALFEKNFGTIKERRSHKNIQDTVCAVGFEPNPNHTPILKGIEKAYQNCGWNAKFFTQTGVSDKIGKSSFFSDNAMDMKEWGGGILPPEINSIALNRSSTEINLIRLSEFLLNTVANRQIPSIRPNTRPPRVLMKMDIEGSEIDVIPDILFSGGFGPVNGLMIEFHKRLEKIQQRKDAHSKLEHILDDMMNLSQSLLKAQGVYDFKVIKIDDETFGTSSMPLPKC